MIKWLCLSGLDDLKTIGDKLFPDPTTMIVQLVATFILVLILAKFLVKPAKRYIEKRKEYIASHIKEAEEQNRLASEKLTQAKQTIKESKQTSKEIISSAKVTALNEKDRIMLETNQEIQIQKAKALQEIEQQRKQMQEELSKEVVDIAISAASKIVNREINLADNEKIIEDFLKDDQQ